MTTLGKYELHEVLGKGGFGTVYRAMDMALDREVALKVLHPAMLVDTGFIQRFRQEARSAAKLDHPHIVPVYDLGESNGQIYLAMKFLPGGSLRDTLSREGAMNFERALSVLRQLASALDYAHGKGLIHRDIKPGNILWEDENNVRISDFGFAKAMTADTSSSYSISGGMVGTPAYMAPEIWRRKSISPATDVYSLGCVFYEMLSGECLFTGDSPADIMTSHVLDGPNFSESWTEGTPPGVAEILTRALANKPEERFPSCGAFAAAIEKIKQAGREQIMRDLSSTEQAEGQRWERAPVEAESKQETREAANRASHEIAERARLEAEDCVRREAEERERKAVEEKAKQAAAECERQAAEEKDRREAEEENARIESQKDNRLWVKLAENEGMEFVRVPAGKFNMGSNDYNEESMHEVNLDEYWLGRYPVTNAQYAVFVKEKEYRVPSHWKEGEIPQGKEDHPVVQVSWEDAQAFCAWLSQESGQKIVLPTEAQWEKAARGTDERKYPWGSSLPDKPCCNFMYDVGDTTPVGMYSPLGDSPYDCADMSGNVWEWVSDWYGRYPSSEQSNPFGPDTGKYRVMRGGGWDYVEKHVRSSFRGRNVPESIFGDVGFRCARSQP